MTVPRYVTNQSHNRSNKRTKLPCLKVIKKNNNPNAESQKRNTSNIAKVNKRILCGKWILTKERQAGQKGQKCTSRGPECQVLFTCLFARLRPKAQPPRCQCRDASLSRHKGSRVSIRRSTIGHRVRSVRVAVGLT